MQLVLQWRRNCKICLIIVRIAKIYKILKFIFIKINTIILNKGNVD